LIKIRKLFLTVLILMVSLLPVACAQENGKTSVEESKYGTTAVKLVKVKLSDAEAQNKINKTLRGEAAAFAKNCRSDDESSLTSKVTYNQNNLLSIHMEEFVYPKGAVHPTTFWRALTFSLKTGQELELSQLFKKDANYKERINALIQKDIAKRDIVWLTPFQSIDEQQEFYLKDNSLVVYYQLYRYTPYSSGFLEFEIPYGDVADLLVGDLSKK